jgi:acetylglutamate kinase
MLNQLGMRIIVIHGGGPQLDEVSGKMGVKPEKIAGRRITDDATLEMAKMVFAGSINTDILAAIRKHGVLPRRRQRAGRRSADLPCAARRAR